MHYRGFYCPGRDPLKECEVSVKIWRIGSGPEINSLKEKLKLLRILSTNVIIFL